MKTKEVAIQTWSCLEEIPEIFAAILSVKLISFCSVWSSSNLSALLVFLIKTTRLFTKSVSNFLKAAEQPPSGDMSCFESRSSIICRISDGDKVSSTLWGHVAYKKRKVTSARTKICTWQCNVYITPAKLFMWSKISEYPYGTYKSNNLNCFPMEKIRAYFFVWNSIFHGYVWKSRFLTM